MGTVLLRITCPYHRIQNIHHARGPSPDGSRGNAPMGRDGGVQTMLL